MSAAQVIEQLVESVHNRAERRDREHLRRAFEIELERAAEALAADPATQVIWSDGTDVIGSAYERVLTGAERRKAGQFQTPFWAADVMAGWLLREPTRLLLDPGVGAGRLLFRAARRPEAERTSLLGLDADALCVAMADLNLRLRNLRGFAVRRHDFLLDDLPERPDALTCNPPYSRHHVIPPATKSAIHDGFERRLGLRLNRLAALHVLFLVRALEVVAPGGRLAFITPADWLDVGYGARIKRHVLDSAQVEALVILDNDHLFFEGALTTAAITFLRKSGPSTEPTRVVRLGDALPPSDEVVRAAVGEPTELTVEDVKLVADEKWSRAAPSKVRRGTELGELARVRRGIATGCNKFFVISEQVRRQRGLVTDDLLPCVTGPKVVRGAELTRADLAALPDDKPRWVLNCRRAGAEQEETPLGDYLRFGRDELDVPSGYLASRRKPWFALEQRHKPEILFTYMNRQRPRFIRNRASAIPLNTFLIVEPKQGVDADALCQALNAPETLAQLEALRRNYGGGLWKLEPAELSRVRVDIQSY